MVLQAIGRNHAFLSPVTPMDWAVRATLAGSEGLGFALMMSVRNLSIVGGTAPGCQLMGAQHWHFSTIVDRRDGEEETAVQLPRLGSMVLRE